MLHRSILHSRPIDVQPTMKELSTVQMEAIVDNGDLEKGFEPLKSSGLLNFC